MHIALVTHKVVAGDGQGRVNLEVAKAALRRGWLVTLVATEVDPDVIASGASWVRIPVGVMPTALVRNQVFAALSAAWLLRRRKHIDIVHANGFVTWARADVNSAHYVHSAWLRSPYREPLGFGARAMYQRLYTVLNAAWEKKAFRQSRCVVAVSEAVRRHLLEIGVAESQVVVIPNGVDTTEFRPAEPDDRTRCYGERGVTGLFVGDLQTPRKNLDTVLRALCACPGVRLDVVGRVGPSPYPAIAKSMGLGERVTFLGYRRDVANLMRSSEFVVFPSLYEPSGLVLLEGMATGVPVVTATSVGGTELVDDECAIVIDDPRDHAALADAMNRLAASPALRARMGEAGRKRALNLSFADAATRYCDLYQSAKEAAGRRAAGAGANVVRSRST